MSSQNKRKGSEWERDLEDYLNMEGLEARRLPRAGSKDIGDVAIYARDYDIVIEAKNVKSAWSSMKEFLRQAEVESNNYFDKYDKPTIGVVATKTRQSGTGEGRIVLTVDQFINLLRWGGVA